MLNTLWVALNIYYELLLPLLWLLVPLALAWGVTLVLALRSASKAQWRKSLPISGLVGLVGVVLAFVLHLSLTSASLADLDQFADWPFVIGTALVVGVVLMIATWPGLSWLRKSS